MKNLFKIFISLILSLSLALLVSCGDKTPSDKIQGPPLPPEGEENPPIEWPSDWEGIEGPMVDYTP